MWRGRVCYGQSDRRRNRVAFVARTAQPAAAAPPRLRRPDAIVLVSCCAICSAVQRDLVFVAVGGCALASP